MLRREILDELVSWKNRPHHPLVIRGLRQIGKTYIVKQFGKELYENTIYLISHCMRLSLVILMLMK